MTEQINRKQLKSLVRRALKSPILDEPRARRAFRTLPDGSKKYCLAGAVCHLAGLTDREISGLNRDVTEAVSIQSTHQYFNAEALDDILMMTLAWDQGRTYPAEQY